MKATHPIAAHDIGTTGTHGPMIRWAAKRESDEERHKQCSLPN